MKDMCALRSPRPGDSRGAQFLVRSGRPDLDPPVSGRRFDAALMAVKRRRSRVSALSQVPFILVAAWFGIRQALRPVGALALLPQRPIASNRPGSRQLARS
jgi:hypothetical protein